MPLYGTDYARPCLTNYQVSPHAGRGDPVGGDRLLEAGLRKARGGGRPDRGNRVAARKLIRAALRIKPGGRPLWDGRRESRISAPGPPGCVTSRRGPPSKATTVMAADALHRPGQVAGRIRTPGRRFPKSAAPDGGQHHRLGRCSQRQILRRGTGSRLVAETSHGGRARLPMNRSASGRATGRGNRLRLQPGFSGIRPAHRPRQHPGGSSSLPGDRAEHEAVHQADVRLLRAEHAGHS